MERDWVVGALRDWGIAFLAGGEDTHPGMAPPELIAALARHADPRLHVALTALFLLHPAWAASVRTVAASLEGAAETELKARYMAAVYLQNWWRTRLSFCLGDFETLPDLYSREMGLPSPNERYGKTGLVALGAWHASHSIYPGNRVASYYRSADLLFGQLRARQHELA